VSSIEIDKAFVQEQGNRHLRIEERLVTEYLEQIGMPIQFYTKKYILRRCLPLTMTSLVVGDMLCVQGAMKQLGICPPKANSYPVSLRKYMHRNIWASSLAELEHQLREGFSRPIFAKPKHRHKRFTGRIFQTESDLYYTSGISRNLELLCCDVVDWLSEFRVYVVDSEIREMACYHGDNCLMPSENIVESAIHDLSQAGEAYAGYGIDFGVLSTGETALVEMNDGFALGAYAISGENYGQLLIERWAELLSGKKS
jgi:hypothetical protein